MIDKYYLSPEFLHIGCEKPSAYFIPFEKGENPKAEREKSSRFQLLNGMWDFKFYPNVRQLDFTADTFPASETCTEKMKVPYCWQLALMGTDVPNYINQDYPYPVDPPELPDIIPCALYRRTFNAEKKSDKLDFITFEGVSSCFYLWINGKFTGYSQVSHAQSTFNITDKLVSGENTVEVLVIKHCDGSYLEDQDFFRLSGIFRDVYITQRDSVYLKDIMISRDISEDFSKAAVSLKPEFSGITAYDWKLFSPDDKLLQSGTFTGEGEFTIDSPILWNSEVPLRYGLEISYGEEVIYFPLALSKAEIKNSVFYLNGKKIKFYGINRHDSNSETGYAVSVDDMLRDLKILKGANVNMIRTSHYPNDPRFVDMCEKFGFMLVDEADIETHGMGYNYGDWYWDYWAFLSDTPEWEKAYLDRAERLYERDKNYGCVVMWSLGNESGCGENHRKMAQFIRSRDKNAIIHYENAHLEYEEKVNRDFKDISDVESRMYASLDYLEKYLNDTEKKKPFFYCEYVSDKSTGDIPLHWGKFENHDKYTGGCVWEFCDHAVNIGTPEKPKYRYGGDFGDYPNNKACCVDGLVYPDRRPRPGFYDMKQTYIPISAEFSDGKLKVFNKRYFKDISEYDIEVYLLKDGKVEDSLSLGAADIAPRSEKEFAIGFDLSGDNTAVTLRLVLNKDTMYEKKGFCAGFVQFVISSSPVKYVNGNCGELSVKEDKFTVFVTAGEYLYEFSKVTGKLVSLKKDGREYFVKPVEFCMFRQSYSHEGSIERARYDKAGQKTYGVTVEKGENIKITADISFAAAAMPPALKGKAVYTFFPDGHFEIAFTGKVTDNAPPMPRFGLKFSLTKDFENVEYFGYGPKESYSDRYASQHLARYSSTVTQQYEHYVKPCESSAHYMTKFAALQTADGLGFEIYDTSDKGFSFKAVHFDDEQMSSVLHDDELTELDETVVNVDVKYHAENSGPEYLKDIRTFTEKDINFDYIVKPV